MKRERIGTHRLAPLYGAMLFALAGGAQAAAFVQCPGDENGDAVIDAPGTPANVKCKHLAAGDGFITMADGKSQYIFGFFDVTGRPESTVMEIAKLRAEFSAPNIVLDEGDEFYLTLSNVGMMMRPDLFDPHTVHFHGFPQAASIFDGLPESAVAINMGSSLTYYYNVIEPGTFMYHCHAEATEHMQMGMLGNLYVRPAQNKLPEGTPLGSHVHRPGDMYVYNDGDGSTRYDVEKAIQLGSIDSGFHDASLAVAPLPFALMKSDYAVLNGRGYPDTVNPDPLSNDENGGFASQNYDARVTAVQGQKVLLRLSNLSVTDFFTVSTTLGVPMKVIGQGARILRGGGVPEGEDLYFHTNSVTLGGGEAHDVIIDTSDVPPGTYFLYTTNLNYLSNGTEDFGGMMTEIVIQPNA
jgi:FtsP/CotA-like multicopper oxidase with cupredoxin domain